MYCNVWWKPFNITHCHWQNTVSVIDQDETYNILYCIKVCQRLMFSCQNIILSHVLTVESTSVHTHTHTHTHTHPLTSITSNCKWKPLTSRPFTTITATWKTGFAIMTTAHRNDNHSPLHGRSSLTLLSLDDHWMSSTELVWPTKADFHTAHPELVGWET